MNVRMNEMMSDKNDEMGLYEILNIFHDFSLEQQTNQQTDGQALWNLTVAEYDNEGTDE